MSLVWFWSLGKNRGLLFLRFRDERFEPYMEINQIHLKKFMDLGFPICQDLFLFFPFRIALENNKNYLGIAHHITRF
ncbi:hypothetical protein LEP1GSC051_0441 [Leptospira sp. P2653]|nr:hypothetical protein LEP1GSC051_0441 [Leptospira sp. P2653]